MPYDVAVLLTGAYVRETCVSMHQGTYSRIFVAALLIIGKKSGNNPNIQQQKNG